MLEHITLSMLYHSTMLMCSDAQEWEGKESEEQAVVGEDVSKHPRCQAIAAPLSAAACNLGIVSLVWQL
jgi:hypothetical protein